MYMHTIALIIQRPPREGGALLAQKALQTAIKLHTQMEKMNPERLRSSYSTLTKIDFFVNFLFMYMYICIYRYFMQSTVQLV